MGYTSELDGEITITPPIPWADLRNSPFICTDQRHERERLVWLRIEEKTVETGEGTLIRKQAVAIRPSEADELRADLLQHKVQEIIAAHPGHTYAGHILVLGEQSPDIWRVEIQDGKAVEVRPRIVWPDGTEHEAIW